MKRIKRIVAVTGKYTDREGKEKNQYLTVGHLFERPDGTQAVKIEALPVGGTWNGWLNIYALEEQRAPSAHDTAKANGYQSDEEVPF